MMLGPASVAHLTLWVCDNFNPEHPDLTFWGVNSTLLENLKSAEVIRSDNEPRWFLGDLHGCDHLLFRVTGARWTYPAQSGVDVLVKEGLVVCFEANIASDHFYMMVATNPTQVSLSSSSDSFCLLSQFAVLTYLCDRRS